MNFIGDCKHKIIILMWKTEPPEPLIRNDEWFHLSNGAVGTAVNDWSNLNGKCNRRLSGGDFEKMYFVGSKFSQIFFGLMRKNFILTLWRVINDISCMSEEQKNIFKWISSVPFAETTHTHTYTRTAKVHTFDRSVKRNLMSTLWT